MSDKTRIQDVKPGFYWAYTKGYSWPNLIIEVHGMIPFLRVRAWVRSFESKTDYVAENVDPEMIAKVGPRIPTPNNQYGDYDEQG